MGGGGIDIGTPGERAGREWHRKKGRGEGVGTQATTSREPEGAGKEKPNIKVKISLGSTRMRFKEYM